MLPSNVSQHILLALWQTWSKEDVEADPKGDRIFSRWIDLGPEDIGWDDWALVGVIRNGSIRWLSGELISVQEDCLEAGGVFGTIEEPELKVQWVRSSYDGPPGSRVVDWAVPVPEMS